MAKSSIMIDLDDPRSERIAEVLSNKTSKKILGLLADGEMSGSEVSEKLGFPLNTVIYNLKKMVDAGLVEKSKKVFWSSKGKRMDLYRVSDKRIVISPKKIVKGILPTALISGILALGVKIFVGNRISTTNSVQTLTEVSSGAMKDSVVEEAASFAISRSADSAIAPSIPGATISEGVYQTLANAPNSWAWFLIGALTALFILLVWNMKRNERRSLENGE